MAAPKLLATCRCPRHESVLAAPYKSFAKFSAAAAISSSSARPRWHAAILPTERSRSSAASASSCCPVRRSPVADSALTIGSRRTASSYSSGPTTSVTCFICNAKWRLCQQPTKLWLVMTRFVQGGLAHYCCWKHQACNPVCAALGAMYEQERARFRIAREQLIRDKLDLEEAGAYSDYATR
jgi:hypothetical protein